MVLRPCLILLFFFASERASEQASEPDRVRLCAKRPFAVLAERPRCGTRSDSHRREHARETFETSTHALHTHEHTPDHTHTRTLAHARIFSKQAVRSKSGKERVQNAVSPKRRAALESTNDKIEAMLVRNNLASLRLDVGVATSGNSSLSTPLPLTTTTHAFTPTTTALAPGGGPAGATEQGIAARTLAEEELEEEMRRQKRCACVRASCVVRVSRSRRCRRRRRRDDVVAAIASV